MVVSRLRAKLALGASEDGVIATVRSQGYMLGRRRSAPRPSTSGAVP